jgi:serine/threonine-protein kinase HipA
MMEMMRDIADKVEPVIMKVNAQLPNDFPAHIRDSILNGLTDRIKRIV